MIRNEVLHLSISAFNTLAKWFLPLSLSLIISHSRSEKGKWESPLFSYISFEWIFWNAWDLIQLIEWKEKKTQKEKKKKRNNLCTEKRDCCNHDIAVAVAGPIVLILAVSLIHSMRNNNNKQQWNGKLMIAWKFCYNAKTCKHLFLFLFLFSFFQSKMGNNMHALVLCLLLNWIRLPRP